MFVCKRMTKASGIDPSNDDYALVYAACCIRLNRFEIAAKTLQEVLQRSPDNETALYHHSYCLRAIG